MSKISIASEILKDGKDSDTIRDLCHRYEKKVKYKTTERDFITKRIFKDDSVMCEIRNDFYEGYENCLCLAKAGHASWCKYKD